MLNGSAEFQDSGINRENPLHKYFLLYEWYKVSVSEPNLPPLQWFLKVRMSVTHDRDRDDAYNHQSSELRRSLSRIQPKLLDDPLSHSLQRSLTFFCLPGNLSVLVINTDRRSMCETYKPYSSDSAIGVDSDVTDET